MRFLLFIALFTLSYCLLGSCDKPDDDFAEFDDGDEFISVPTKQHVRGSNDGEHRNTQDIEEDDDGIEVENDFDEEEFEGEHLRRETHKRLPGLT